MSTIAVALSFTGALAAATLTGSVRLINTGRGAKDARLPPVVVWLESTNIVASAASPKHAVMVQKDKKFTPHLLAIGAGTSVEFPNFDPIFHNAFSNFNGKVFDIGLYAPGSSRTVRFDRLGIVRVFCNIHPSMSAVIVVLDTPLFTTTESDGTFAFTNVPNDEYEVHFFHERATPETLEKLTRSVLVNVKTSLLPVEISETGYLPVAHANKYGQEYPKGSDAPKGYSLPVK